MLPDPSSVRPQVPPPSPSSETQADGAGASGTSAIRRSRAIGGLVLPALLIAVGIAVYANSLPGRFVFDDIDSIRHLQDPSTGRIRPWRDLARGLRPLLTLSLGVNFAWGGDDPAGYHIVNIGIHLAAGLALYGLMRRTLRLPKLAGKFTGVADGIAFVTAMLWIVHPLQTESVTYIVQRCESMMGMFFLLTMYAYLRGATCLRRQAWLWYGASFVTYCLGLLSKESMVTVLPVLWLYDRVFLASSWREIGRRRGGWHLAFAVPLGGASTVLIPAAFAGGSAAVGFGIDAVSPWEYARSQPGVILHYLRLAALPHPQCLDYGWAPETRWTHILIPGLVLLGMLSASLWLLLRGQPLGFLGTAFFLILAPTSSVLPFKDLCFEHRMYLPLACVLAAVVPAAYSGFGRLPPQAGRVAGVALTLGVVATWSGLTIARNRVYHSPLEMWMDVLHKTRHYRAGDVLARSLNNTAIDLIKEGQLQQGVMVLQQATVFCPPLPEIELNLARALLESGDAEAALPHAQTAVRLRPDVAACQHLMGQLTRKRGRPQEAEEFFRAARRLAPGDITIQRDLAQCLADQRRFEEALRIYEDVLAVNPGAADVRHRLATTLAAAGRLDEAVVQADEMARRAPRDPRPHVLLGMIEHQRRAPRAALRHLLEALRLDPRLAAVHCLAAKIRQGLGDRDGAVRSYREALALDRNMSEARQGLSEILGDGKP